jgi:hypothetical protein
VWSALLGTLLATLAWLLRLLLAPLRAACAWASLGDFGASRAPQPGRAGSGWRRPKTAAQMAARASSRRRKCR